jgi:hypothetical protein
MILEWDRHLWLEISIWLGPLNFWSMWRNAIHITIYQPFNKRNTSFARPLPQKHQATITSIAALGNIGYSFSIEEDSLFVPKLLKN